MELFARSIEKLGYNSLWLGDHIVIPVKFKSAYPMTSSGRPPWSYETEFLDPMVALAFVAGCTTTIRLHTNIVPVFNRDPASLAKQVGSLDQLSRGRFELGLGTGWLIEEAQALRHAWDRPLARLAEMIDVLRLAWSKPAFSFSGKFYDYDNVGIHPQPMQGGDVPIWIGGRAPATLRLVANKECVGVSLWLDEKTDV
jgi:probable F420-dependent oxidoreductase